MALVYHGRHYSLLDVGIETGRTHQIRPRMTALGHPVTGDRLYGARRPLSGLARQFLHASLLGLRLPSNGEYREFTSAAPGRPRRRARGAGRDVRGSLWLGAFPDPLIF